MKHILIVAVGLIGLAVLLNLDRIRNHLHPLRSQAAEAVPAVAESGRAVVQPPQTNVAVTVMPTATTNAPGTKGPATWQSTLAQDYAHLINDIRATRGN